MPPLPVLHLDDRMVVVDKPSGLLVHRSPIDRHETRFALQIVRDQLGRRVYPVHRLDKGTSGALALALDPEAAAVLSQAFARREVAKHYVALVRGWPPPVGTVERALATVADDRVTRCEVSTPQPATTRFRCLERYGLPLRVDRYPTSRYALVELAPQTGRRHQLRRHLAGASHPVIGDSTYGKGRHNRLFAERFGVRRLLLACTALEFAKTPGHDAPLRVEAPLAAEFAALVAALRAQHGAG